MPHWTPDNLTSQNGKTFLITGANSGLGYWSTLHLARKGAQVIMACRGLKKAEAARAEILRACPAIAPEQLTLRVLDLADLDSVAQAAKDLLEKGQALDGLLNNAGVMALPQQKTAQGFEMQFGTNHLGHFALSAQLLPLLEKAEAARVVTVTSIYHRQGSIDFDNLQGELHYQKWNAYARSKLANLLFALELQRRLSAHESTVQSFAAHPGYAATNLQSAGPKAENTWWKQKLMELANGVLAQSAEQGAYQQLFAMTEPNISGGSFWGPNGFKALRGYPVQETPSEAAQDKDVAAKLWQVSEQLTGQHFLSKP
jgi:NAD(P)-dependent dehydrogenase (short-subunit alcohol dehydrogenase family)